MLLYVALGLSVRNDTAAVNHTSIRVRILVSNSSSVLCLILSLTMLQCLKNAVTWKQITSLIACIMLQLLRSNPTSAPNIIIPRSPGTVMEHT